jgi:N-methylhydantoinase A
MIEDGARENGDLRGARWRVSTDTGGTFTDLIAMNEAGELRVAKVPSTPPNFEGGVVAALLEVGIPIESSEVLYHGTTVTTNALLTRGGALTALVTTKGFRDVLEIRNGNRADVFDVMWDQPAPLARRANRLEVNHRMNYAGEVLVELDDQEVRDIARKLRKRGIEAVAVSLLHSYVNPEHEQRIAEILREELPDVYISVSTEIMAEPPEFERASTVVANAYVGPILKTYVDRLAGALREAGHSGDVLIMHSGGGMMSSASATEVPVRTAISGPAGGAVAAAALGAAIGRDKVVSFDMGGTSADLATIRDGQPRLAQSHDIEWGMPVNFPSVDIAAIGAGGGSIAWIDEGGAPRSGPQSAGSVPGPACYGRGGEEPTNTDANLVLGRLSAEALIGGNMELDVELARRAIERRIAEPLGIGVEEAALGVLRIANENMANAIRKLTVERGLDPREFSLMAFGGGGAMHGAELARELNMREVVVPTIPGATSALGILFVDNVHNVGRAYLVERSRMAPAEIEELFAELEGGVRETLAAEGFGEDLIEVRREMELRYEGQVRALTVPLADGPVDDAGLDAAVARFHELYADEFKYAMTGNPVESKSVRVVGVGTTQKPEFARDERTGTAEQALFGSRPVCFGEEGFVETQLYDRDRLLPGAQLSGPAVIQQYDTTTIVPPGAEVTVDEYRNLLITTGEMR